MNPNDLQMLFQMLGQYGSFPSPGGAGVGAVPGRTTPSAPSSPSQDALAQYKAIMQMLAAQNPQMMAQLRQIGPGGMPAMANQLKPYTTQPAHGSWADYAPQPPPPRPTPYPGSVAPRFVGGYRGVAPPIGYGGSGYRGGPPTRIAW